MTIYRFNPFIEKIEDEFELAVLEQLSSAPLDNIFNMSINEIRNSSKTIEFNASRYDMRPDLVSWDNYNSYALSNLITLVNNCTSLFNFTREKIGNSILLPDILFIKKLLNSTIK